MNKNVGKLLITYSLIPISSLLCLAASILDSNMPGFIHADGNLFYTFLYFILRVFWFIILFGLVVGVPVLFSALNYVQSKNRIMMFLRNTITLFIQVITVVILACIVYDESGAWIQLSVTSLLFTVLMEAIAFIIFYIKTNKTATSEVKWDWKNIIYKLKEMSIKSKVIFITLPLMILCVIFGVMQLYFKVFTQDITISNIMDALFWLIFLVIYFLLITITQYGYPILCAIVNNIWSQNKWQQLLLNICTMAMLGACIGILALCIQGEFAIFLLKDCLLKGIVNLIIAGVVVFVLRAVLSGLLLYVKKRNIEVKRKNLLNRHGVNVGIIILKTVFAVIMQVIIMISISFVILMVLGTERFPSTNLVKATDFLLSQEYEGMTLEECSEIWGEEISNCEYYENVTYCGEEMGKVQIYSAGYGMGGSSKPYLICVFFDESGRIKYVRIREEIDV